MVRDFFKKIGVNQSAFMAFIFYSITIYVLADRAFELFYLTTSGSFIEYTRPIHPILYAFIIPMPILGFAYLCSSPVVKLGSDKIKYFMISLLAFILLIGTMATQFINQFAWYLMRLDMTRFNFVIKNYSEYINPALMGLLFLLPLCSFLTIIEFFHEKIYDDDDYRDGITDYKGIDTSVASNETGQFTCEVVICRDAETSKPIIVPEKKRYEQTLIQGATGTGKTATLLEPMSAMDLERKYFFREYSKKVAYTLLKKGFAYIEGPVSNDYLNENFSLNYVMPKKGKEDEYRMALKNVILFESDGKFYFKNLGITIVENDGNFIKHFKSVAENYGISVLSVDPTDEDSMGINPFVINDPSKVASIISDVLKAMYETDGGGGEQFFADVTASAFQNISILLKLMYPRLHNGELPTLEDILIILQNFDNVEELVEELKRDNELEKEYRLLIAYFERNFYKPPVNIQGFALPTSTGSGRKDTERFLYGAITQLDNLLKNPGMKRALCKRRGNVDFDKALAEGHVITACSKRELGIMQSKAFGMFFILQFQDAVLRRPGSEDNRVPHFLYIDEFPEYINKETGVMFTLFRKYRCAVTIAIQNLSQLEKVNKFKYYRQEVLANTKTQIVFGDTNPEDSAYWSASFGKDLKLDTNKSYTYDEYGNPQESGKKTAMDDKDVIKSHRLSVLPFKTIMYKTKNLSGKTVRGKGKTDFLHTKYKEPHPIASYNFERFMITKPIMSNVTPETFFEDSSEEIFTASNQGVADVSPIYSDDINVNNVIGTPAQKATTNNSNTDTQNTSNTTSPRTNSNPFVGDIVIDTDPIIEQGEYSKNEIHDFKKSKEDPEIVINKDFDEILIDIMGDDAIKIPGNRNTGRKKNN